jgi:flagellar basal-body rod modification protein FlgD
MDVGSIANAAANEASTNRTQLSANFDMFLRLLTTQLQNQDPLEPTDTNQFTQQLVQYSQVEQQIKSNEQLASLVNLQGNLQLQSALSYVGMDVRVADDRFNYAGQGNTTFDYAFDENASQTKINIVNENGDVVFTANGALEGTKLHSFTWDGKDNNGLQAPQGQYSIRVSVLDGAGKAQTAETAVWGQVTGIEQINGKAILKLGDIPVDLSAIMAAQVHKPTNNNL